MKKKTLKTHFFLNLYLQEKNHKKSNLYSAILWFSVFFIILIPTTLKECNQNYYNGYPVGEFTPTASYQLEERVIITNVTHLQEIDQDANLIIGFHLFNCEDCDYFITINDSINLFGDVINNSRTILFHFDTSSAGNYNVTIWLFNISSPYDFSNPLMSLSRIIMIQPKQNTPINQTVVIATIVVGSLVGVAVVSYSTLKNRLGRNDDSLIPTIDQQNHDLSIDGLDDLYFTNNDKNNIKKTINKYEKSIDIDINTIPDDEFIENIYKGINFDKKRTKQ